MHSFALACSCSRRANDNNNVDISRCTTLNGDHTCKYVCCNIGDNQTIVKKGSTVLNPQLFIEIEILNIMFQEWSGMDYG